MINYNRSVKRGLFVFVILALVAYGLFQSKKLIEGPQITIFEPQNGATLTGDLVTIRGVAKNIAYIWLDDTPIFVDNNGQFDEQLVVPQGYSTIKVSAQDKFGKKTQELIRVELPVSNLPAATSTPNIAPIATSTATSTR
jgi:Glucodextranase, domain B